MHTKNIYDEKIKSCLYNEERIWIDDEAGTAAYRERVL